MLSIFRLGIILFFINVSSYQIQDYDVCQSKTSERGIVTRAKPNGPTETDTMGRYGCSAYSENSCCSNEEAQAMYNRKTVI